ncbi:ATP phosphoribosyltransferase [Alkaliphilus metalliredigens QYMF]|uniref:ATP phosphoribosyltransferase n=1 Tax=Alkaliphilus metalliredigens (strain QYMF) TaxID=293826 RepID=HIS1_ALKMQ|nr:ATP phosphoribosyltransferase [Alkaliphilus metalliredigens]A6TKT0.1 RecName: Full=ATP phosphoribosyltransferase; Short=ATP-PRT; Short=ATP-PRTase [Alkaliphilus metalliredigens QYMF]ABR46798.1 ATP phosphoribosyltransferase [Alkaliphilus metalliredigens QYMF]
MNVIKIALAKGRLADQSVKLLESIGIDCGPLLDKGRKLIVALPKDHLEVVFVKAPDVPTYVEHGAVDMGIVGKDVLLEANKQLYEVLDLQFGKCKFSVAGSTSMENYPTPHMRVATKYPNIAKNFFQSKGQSVEIIKQEGSVELAPMVGLADVIVDIVETGNTLRENGLMVFEDIVEISARLVLNQVSYKTKHQEIRGLIDRIAEKTGK